jgi:hypothetical protein
MSGLLNLLKRKLLDYTKFSKKKDLGQHQIFLESLRRLAKAEFISNMKFSRKSFGTNLAKGSGGYSALKL